MAIDPEGQMPLRSFRYERKFLVDELDWQRVHALIRAHPALFIEPYPPRYVNNFYLDTREMQFYQDNILGASQRLKVRVRWYGKLFGLNDHPILEMKIKDGLVGTKRQYGLKDFSVDWNFTNGSFRKMLEESDLPLEIQELLRNLELVLLNRYHRRYFATHDNRFRVTLDTEMAYLRVQSLQNQFAHHQVDHRTTIVELKYDVAQDLEANRISSFFPFRVTKSSKYVHGIDRVYF